MSSFRESSPVNSPSSASELFGPASGGSPDPASGGSPGGSQLYDPASDGRPRDATWVQCRSEMRTLLLRVHENDPDLRRVRIDCDWIEDEDLEDLAKAIATNTHVDEIELCYDRAFCFHLAVYDVVEAAAGNSDLPLTILSLTGVHYCLKLDSALQRLLAPGRDLRKLYILTDLWHSEFLAADVLPTSRLESLFLMEKEMEMTSYGAFSHGALAKMLAMGSNLEHVEVLVRPEEIVDVLKALANNTKLVTAFLICIEDSVEEYLSTATQPLARIRSAVWDLAFVNKTLCTMEIRMIGYLAPYDFPRRLFIVYAPAVEKWVSMARILHHSADRVIRMALDLCFGEIFKFFLNTSARRCPRPTKWVPWTNIASTAASASALAASGANSDAAATSGALIRDDPSDWRF